jgi:hypothetical protein
MSHQALDPAEEVDATNAALQFYGLFVCFIALRQWGSFAEGMGVWQNRVGEAFRGARTRCTFQHHFCRIHDRHRDLTGPIGLDIEPAGSSHPD